MIFPLTLQDLEVIFSNIIDIAEFTANLLSSLEDALELSEQQTGPSVGNCMEELAEVIDAHHEKTDLKVFVVVIPKEGWARVAAPILLLV